MSFSVHGGVQFLLYSPPVQLPYMSVLADRQQAEKKARKNFSDVAIQWREFLLGLQEIELQPRSLYLYSYIDISLCVYIYIYIHMLVSISTF